MDAQTYEVVDSQTKEVVATRATRRAANAKADKLDLEYGAIRYWVRGAVNLTTEGEK